jgi:hypothetical protein
MFILGFGFIQWFLRFAITLKCEAKVRNFVKIAGVPHSSGVAWPRSIYLVHQSPSPEFASVDHA